MTLKHIIKWMMQEQLRKLIGLDDLYNPNSELRKALDSIPKRESELTNKDGSE